VCGDRGICRLRPAHEYRCPAGKRQCRPAIPPRCGQRGKHRFRTRADVTILPDPLHGLGKLLRRNLRKLPPHDLRALVVHPVAGDRLPGLDPPAAKTALPIVDQKRFCGHPTRLAAFPPGFNLETAEE
jgi:hypothetical protein